MNTSHDSVLWDARSAAPLIAVPSATDTKYSRGVLGVATGSKRYPGAAVLSVEAAYRTGLGMVRYLGPRRARDLVLVRRPEVVCVPGKVQAWLVGSGMDASTRSHTESIRLQTALQSGTPVVIDAGALDLASSALGPVVITPHARELATLLLSVSASLAEKFSTVEELTFAIASQPERWVQEAADELNVTVLLKGNVTHVATPRDARGARFHARIQSPTTWLATAGTGDVLAGILGALIATHAERVLEDPDVLGPLAATAALLHGMAAERAANGGPIAAMDVAQALPATVATIL
ncbi:MAG: NAD(P)H-hydrate dehydratase [Actinomycetales bacterium]|nr:NAD(P)H-hydrate dehydratase [Actinomycetales bacterium]